jgi:hypothetical protein
MPKYTFRCSWPGCLAEVQRYTSVNTEQIECPVCDGALSNRQLPSSGSQAVSEIIDDFTGVKRDQNHDIDVKTRREQHYWEVEVPRFIETYSTQTCLEEGWLVYDEKGNLVINKPPSKR